ncbi:hypothetical protein F7734_41205 [Scytonema sp. UIC 10036]|uniref:hypothetical protein n=1 Tax=Scytonema sp. UIC 10036 TaxID=2304196 RepID=UPI0012DA1DCA|nr:hypothetical protein [Scytonema sp. UIC 10036]MUG98382.1 hypothetical protein [Scytonema sp. UIC 10036]
MPYTLNGCGTKYYGKRELLSDESYITTEWIVIAYVPLIPIGSFRVQPTGKSSYYIIGSSSEYLVRRVPFNWKQIRNTYLAVITIVSIISGGLWLMEQFSSSKTPKQTKLSPTASEICFYGKLAKICKNIEDS